VRDSRTTSATSRLHWQRWQEPTTSLSQEDANVETATTATIMMMITMTMPTIRTNSASDDPSCVSLPASSGHQDGVV